MARKLAFRIVEVGDVGSTMDEAKKLRATEEGTVVVARSQTDGVGRLGRKWHSPVGGLWFTIIIYPRQSATTSPLLTLMAALAVCKGITRTIGLQPTIRWPNDVCLHGKKVAGILVEMDVVGDTVSRALVGVGVNANFNLEQLPPDVRDEATTLTHEMGSEVKLELLLANILDEFAELYYFFKTGRKGEIMKDVKNVMQMLGEKVKVSLSDGIQLMGVMENLDELGRVVLRLDQDRIFLSPGDIERIVTS